MQSAVVNELTAASQGCGSVCGKDSDDVLNDSSGFTPKQFDYSLWISVRDRIRYGLNALPIELSSRLAADHIVNS